MEVMQLKTVVAEAVKEVTGQGDITAENVALITDTGREVIDLNDTALVENFTKQLVNRIAKIVVDDRRFMANLPDMYVDSWDWGAFLERVYTQPLDYTDDNAFNLTDGTIYSDDLKFFSPKVQAKIYSELKTINVPLSISEVAFRTAFTSWDEMNKVISKIRQSVEDTLQLAYEVLGKMLVMAGIAISVDATQTAIFLLDEYEALSGNTFATTEKALQDAGFLRYACQRIGNVRDFMENYGAFYNDKSILTHTPKSDQRLILLSQFEKPIATNLLADTYHTDRLAIGDYKVFGYWQGVRSETTEGNLTFADNSTVSVNDATNKLGIGEGEKTYNNVVGFLYDKFAIGLTYNNRRTTSSYVANAEFYNTFNKYTANWLVDTHYNMIAFLLRKPSSEDSNS